MRRGVRKRHSPPAPPAGVELHRLTGTGAAAGPGDSYVRSIDARSEVGS